MKTLDLDFITRFKLSGILDQVDGNLGKLKALGAIFDKVRFSEEEAKRIVTKQTGDLVTFSTPEGEPEFGKITVEIEDSQAEFLMKELDTWPHFRIADLTWVEKLKAGLK